MTKAFTAEEQVALLESVKCDWYKGMHIHAVLYSMVCRLEWSVANMQGRKSTKNGIGVNGDVCKAIHKGRKVQGAVESYDSVRVFVSGIWTHGIAPHISEVGDEYELDGEALDTEAKLWETGERSVWKATRKSGKKPVRSPLSPPDLFLKWFDGMSATNQAAFLKSAKGKKITALEVKS